MNFINFSNKFTKVKGNADAKDVFDFISSPKNIHSMVVLSDLGLPALTGLVSELENRWGSSANFPLSDFRNRQYVGRMARYILDFFGYTPFTGGLDERAQLKKFANAQLFKTASVYKKTHSATKNLKVVII